MIAKDLHELAHKLCLYRAEVERTLDPEAMEGGQMIAATLERLISALRDGEETKAFAEMSTFSRQVSDAYYTHPPILAEISETMRRLQNQLKQR